MMVGGADATTHSAAFRFDSKGVLVRSGFTDSSTASNLGSKQ